jgi:hypothetical protein
LNYFYYNKFHFNANLWTKVRKTSNLVWLVVYSKCQSNLEERKSIPKSSIPKPIFAAWLCLSVWDWIHGFYLSCSDMSAAVFLVRNSISIEKFICQTKLLGEYYMLNPLELNCSLGQKRRLLFFSRAILVSIKNVFILNRNVHLQK